MSYIESVIETANLGTLGGTAPKEVVMHALSLRDSPITEEAASFAGYSLEIENLTEENQNLFQTRVFGGLATKLALLSSFSEKPALSTLPVDDQLQELENLMSSYAVANDGEVPFRLLAAPSRYSTLSNVPNSLVRSWVYDSRRAQTSLTDHLKAIKSYIDVTPGTFPPQPYYIKPIGANDVTLVQAFGRDSIADEGLVHIRDIHESKSDAVMLEYLDHLKFKPGDSNIDLADVVAQQLQSASPIEQILQWEVAYALHQKYPEVYEKFGRYIHTVWPHRSSYPTYEVKQDSVEIMDKFGLYNAQELAHPDMMARAVAILEKLGVQPDPIAADIRYDAESTQPHVRSVDAFKTREFLARAEHILFGRVRF